MKKKLKSFLIYFASGAAVIAVALGAMWFFMTPTVTTSTFDAKEPESYEEIFEVFMQARQHLMEAGDLYTGPGFDEDEAYLDAEDADLISADEAQAEAEWAAENANDPLADQELTAEELAALDGIEIDSGYYDPDFIAEYEAMHAEGQQEDDHFLDDELIDDGDFALDEEDFAFDDDDEFFNEDDDFLGDEEFYFDEDELFTGDSDKSLCFSDQTLVQLYNEGARNPARVIADEATNGEFLFVATSDMVNIIQVHADGTLELAGNITIEESAADAAAGGGASAIAINTARERFVDLFLVEDRLVAISTARIDALAAEDAVDTVTDEDTTGEEAGGEATPPVDGEADAAFSEDELMGMPLLLDDPTYTRVQVFDVSAPASPNRINSYLITGSYSGSRIMGADLYLATDYGVFDYENISLDTPETFIPYIETAGERTLALPSEVRIASDMENRETVYTQLVSINLSGQTSLSSQVAFLGGSNVLYAGASKIYITNNSEVQQGRNFAMAAAVTQISMESGQLSFGRTVTLPGMIEGPEFLNEREGLLRVVAPSFVSAEMVTDTEVDYRINMQIFVLDQQMETIGTLDGFQEGVDLFPDHFLGDVLYLESIDDEGQNFAIDFSDPRNPQKIVLSEGNYLPEVLHPWTAVGGGPEVAAGLPTGGTEWLGLGTFMDEFIDEEVFFEDEEGEFDEVTDEHIEDDGDSSIALVMHYLQDGDGAEDITGNVRHNTPIAGHHFSDAFTDAESLTVDAAANVIGFPADYTYLLYSFDDQTGFSRRVEQAMSDQFSPGSFTRGVIAGDFFLIVHVTDTVEMWTYSLNDFTLTGRLRLAE